MVWRGSPTPQRIERACGAFTAISERLGGQKLSLLAIIEESSPPPEVEHFHLVVRGFDDIADRLLHTVGVLEERVATSALLEAASIIRSLQRQPRPTKFCADAREACTWLAARHPHDGDAPEFQAALLAAIEATRARLGPA